MNNKTIQLKGVRTHNLKSVDIEIGAGELVVLTGVSGSGKSSLAFDTLYIEGQRRYVQSLSNYARRQLGDLAKPDMESASGITPTISIEQKTAGKNPRSTVGTMTEIYDFLRVLFARISIPHCPVSGEAVMPQSRERIIKTVQSLPEKTKILILAPYARGKKAEFREDFVFLLRKGYMRARVDGEILELETPITLDGSQAHDVDIVIDRVVVEESNFSRIAESLTQALELGQGVCSVSNSGTEEEVLYSMHAFSPKSGLSYEPLEPQNFSFNTPSGMCPRCQGMGITNEFDLNKIINPDLSIAQDCCSIASSHRTVRYGNIYDNLAEMFGFDVRTPWKKLSPKAKEIFLYGTGDRWLKMHFVHPVTGYRWSDRVQWRGVLGEAHRRITEAKSIAYRKKMGELMHRDICQECRGSRLQPYPSVATLHRKTIHEISQMTVADCLNFFTDLPLSETERKIASELLKEIRERLFFLNEVGLSYLTLERTAPTLSGGEAQRVRLASQIGCGLVGVTYILDEPSIGLHPRDNQKLLHTLKQLRDIGNTVVVVEHDEETILACDRIIDFGPGAGAKGGEVIVNGTLRDLLKQPKSLTGAYLKGTEKILIPKKRRKPNGKTMTIQGASHHNLKHIDVKIPIGVFVCVTGVSGSGKSSLISDILYPALANRLQGSLLEIGAHQGILGVDEIDKVIGIDQSPIGRNPRSNPATYIKLFDEIRDLFSQLPESRARGYSPGRFSFNVKEGTCPQCSGMGMVMIDMDFMEADWVECDLCHGRRFDPETLSVFYKGKNISDVLEMDVAEACEFFKPIPSIRKKLEMLHSVGMDYIKLGQSSTTLSGGEAQRVKLAKELIRPSTGKTLYILDEPTTGLHFHDIRHLLEVLQELVERGNTVLVIEHNMDVVKTADWVIDLGPEGGKGGGEIVAEGPPEKIARLDTPTGHAIKETLARKPITFVNKKKMKKPKEEIEFIEVEAAEQNNLKRIDAAIPREKITVCTGPSGSGKSSFAFETIYAEGQRRYVESLSPYARQFIQQMAKPKVGRVAGLSPAIAIEQKIHAGNPRSTVGTMTEVYDYLRILYARIGIPHSPETGERIKAISKDHVVERILEFPEGEKVQILAPISVKRSEDILALLSRFQRQGYLRVRLNGTFFDLENLEEIPVKKKQKNELMLVIDRVIVNPTLQHRLLESVENAAKQGENKVVVMREEKDLLFNLSFSVESTGQSYPEITPQTFAFNHREGMCPECMGLGYQYGVNLTQHDEIMSLSPFRLISILWGPYTSPDAYDMLYTVLKEEKIPSEAPLTSLTGTQLSFLLHGSQRQYQLNRGTFFRWEGINNVLTSLSRSAQNELRSAIALILDKVNCVACKGARLNPLARHVTIHQKAIHEICEMSLDHALHFIETIPVHTDILQEVKTQLLHRLSFLHNVGLDYMTLNRQAPTLSGGETQRIRLARQLGSGLTGVLYVLDEPTIGLHPHDNDKLNQALLGLKELGNTLLLVEHDPLTIAHADYLLDFGPQSGTQGGYVTARGTLKQILRNPHSLTGCYLSGKKTVPFPKERNPIDGPKLSVRNATLHNLKHLAVEFPLHAITCLTGVSGSGKSTLMHDILLTGVQKGLQGRLDHVKWEYGSIEGIGHFDSVIEVDQNPIGTTVRSNVGTYVGLLERVRDFFAELPEAKVKGLKPGNFSFNHRKGMCSSCQGLGYKRVELHFLPPVEVVCEDCKGLRLNPISLSVYYQGKNFGEHLNTTVEEARLTFENIPRIRRILDILISVGLGYLKLGQEMHTLSGGEAQRIKLSGELAKRSTGHTLYLLDEPTTGLHSDDIVKLLHILHTLITKGNTIIVIEHNLDVIKNGDYIIDMGPGAGSRGGRIIATGRPEEIAMNKESITGKYLQSYLQDA